MLSPTVLLEMIYTLLLPLLALRLPRINGLDVATNYINASSTDFSPVHLSINTVDTSRRNKTASMLYGLMHEDISHSGDGGIYAELLRNRAFQGTPVISTDNPIEPYAPVLDGWSPIGSAQISLDPFHPLSSALPTSLQITIPANATGEVGIENFGFWGMDISPGVYTFSTNILALNSTYPSNSTTTFTASLRSNATGTVWASSEIGPLKVNTFRFGEINTTITNNATAEDGNNTFALTMNGEEVAGMTLYFALFSLFPETFKGRQNGLRKDLASSLYDMSPAFLRCPGGNNLEGQSISTRFKWWESIGPLSQRPGRIGDWGYYNTGGLGLMEYFDWAEDMEMQPLLAIYAGYSLDGTSYPEEYMDEVLQEALDELEFCFGDNSTKWGAKRIEYGHPEPYNISYVEIGNEDWFSNTYQYRFKYMYDGLKQAYPNITFISTAYNENPSTIIDIPKGAFWDTHHYQTPSFFVQDFDFYDNWQETNDTQDVGVFIGEYSVFQLDTSDGIVNYSNPNGIHIPYPQQISALGESTYLLGAERNPKVVQLSSYAPMLQHRNATEWTPNLISFEAQHSKTVLSASYWWMWLFGRFRGVESVPVDAVSGDLNPLFWGGSIGKDCEVYLKVINTGNKTVDLSLDLDASYTSSNGTTIQNDNVNAFNFVYNQTEVYPREVNGTALPTLGAGSANTTGNGTWSWTVPIFSITVLQFNK